MDITSFTGQIAVVTSKSQPAAGDWHDAEWVRVAPAGTSPNIWRGSLEYRYVKLTGTMDGATDSAWLRVTVGATGADIVLTTAGAYDMYAKLTGDPESPGLLCGTFNVT